MSEYSIQKANSSKDFEDVIDFLYEYFVPFEPINSAIKLCDKGYRYLNIKISILHFKSIFCAECPTLMHGYKTALKRKIL